ncbi:SecY interacting protein Syd [Bacillus cereus]|uniref:SecY-interacting protein Syd n=1 Tax=Bacillus cereus TaxID=1396 RepID=A0AB73UEG7_BACCE|nr:MULTISPECIES: SecY-interacting protein Syd [Bacillus]NIE93979.1 SecY-interacting protein Syd [Bacillus sp. Ab-1751]MDR4156665.1 SecY-interacting protein Syd [Bacillus cereus]MEB9860640.1 SecY-interacting protein Syd [Bacillus cereus]MEB9934436.1 SecY-interacting protein Syd [Bacillus cereus]MEB9959010.1 SecY-interacting protein Syd [Bacillus cereus]
MKNEMKNCFDKIIREWQDCNNSLPKSLWIEEAETFIYEGEPDTEGYVFWKPLEKNIIHDFSDIEKDLGIELHNSIKEYYNSYWFLDLGGNYLGYDFELNPVIPGIELHDFYVSLQGYRGAHDNQLNNIPIGMEFNGLLVVVDNENGQVKLEDYESRSFEVICDSLAELILNLS